MKAAKNYANLFVGNNKDYLALLKTLNRKDKLWHIHRHSKNRRIRKKAWTLFIQED